MEEANNLKPNKVVVAKSIWKEYSTGKTLLVAMVISQSIISNYFNFFKPRPSKTGQDEGGLL